MVPLHLCRKYHEIRSIERNLDIPFWNLLANYFYYRNLVCLSKQQIIALPYSAVPSNTHTHTHTQMNFVLKEISSFYQFSIITYFFFVFFIVLVLVFVLFICSLLCSSHSFFSLSRKKVVFLHCLFFVISLL